MHEHSLPWAWTYQPLYEIREYFGDDVGLYFSWLGMYTQSLFLLSLFGSLTMALQPFFGGSPDKNPFTIAYSVCVESPSNITRDCSSLPSKHYQGIALPFLLNIT